MATGCTSTDRLILVVDDDPAVCAMLERTLSKRCAAIYTTTSPTQAESLLRQHPITHVLVDNLLGPEVPLGKDLLPRWRRTYPTIRWAAVFSGGDLSQVHQGAGIDAVLAKWEDVSTVLEAIDAERTAR